MKPFFGSAFAAKVVAALNVAGFETRYIGGCVRDKILGKAVNDIDLATTALPQQVKQCLKKIDVRTIPTGLAYGTVTAIDPKSAIPEPIQITTLRQDVATDGRHAEVEYTNNWQLDAARRDFTMNALSMDCNGKVYDYFDGQADLKNGPVRFIGDPHQRIQEDYLRILRYFRFLATHQQEPIDDNSLQACKTHKKYIALLSGQRVREEVEKLLQAKHASDILELLQTHDVFAAIFYQCAADIQAFKTVQQYSAIRPITDILMLTVLLGVFPTKLCQHWCMGKKLQQYNQLLHCHSLVETIDYSVLAREGKRTYQDLVLYAGARKGLSSEEVLAHLNSIPKTLKKFPINGNDVIAHSGLKGPAVGIILQELKQYWLREQQQPDKKKLLAYMREL